MEPAEIKKILKSAWYTKLQLHREELEVEELRALATRITPTYSLTPGSGNSNASKLEDNVIRITEAEERRNESVSRLLKNMENIHKLIDTLDDEGLRLLLNLRYIHHKRWEEVAVIMGYTFRRVTQLHAEALNLLAQHYKQA